MPCDRINPGRLPRRLTKTVLLAVGVLCCLPVWSRPPDPGTLYVHRAQHSDVVLLTNGQGRVVSSRTYTPYGRPIRNAA